MMQPGRAERLAWWAGPLLLSLLPLCWFTYPNLDDLPNHAARVGLEEAFIAGHRSAYYEPAWAVAPNWALDAIAPVLSRWTGPLLATKAVLAAGCLLVSIGTLALSQVLHRRWNVYPLLAGLVANSLYVHYGLINYVVSVGLALCGTAWWIGRPRPLRWTAHAGAVVFGTAVYLAHLGGVLALAVGVVAGELSRREGRAGRFVSASSALAWHGAVPLLLQVFLQQPGSDVTDRFPTSWADFLVTKLVLLFAIPGWYVDSTEAVSAVSVFALLLCLYAPARQRWLVVHPFVGWSSGLFAFAMLVVPRHGFGTMMLDIRIALPLGCCLLAGVCLRSTAQALMRGRAIGATVMAVAVLTSTTLCAVWRAPDAEQRQLRERLALLPARLRLAVVDLRGEQRALNVPSPHAAAWYALDRDGLVSTLYGRPYEAFPIRFKAAAAAMADGARPMGPPPVIEALCGRFDRVVVTGRPGELLPYLGTGWIVEHRTAHVLLARPAQRDAAGCRKEAAR